MLPCTRDRLSWLCFYAESQDKRRCIVCISGHGGGAEKQSLNKPPPCQTVFDTHIYLPWFISYTCYCRHHAKHPLNCQRHSFFGPESASVWLIFYSSCPPALFSTPLLSAVIIIDWTSLLNNLHDLKIFEETWISFYKVRYIPSYALFLFLSLFEVITTLLF